MRKQIRRKLLEQLAKEASKNINVEAKEGLSSQQEKDSTLDVAPLSLQTVCGTALFKLNLCDKKGLLFEHLIYSVSFTDQ